MREWQLKKNVFKLYLAKFMELPLWVKQAFYVKLKENISKYNCASFLETPSQDMFSLYIPILTYKGRTEIEERKNGLDSNIYNFLSLCKNDYSILEISLNMLLTMEEAAKYFMFCVEQDYLELPFSDEVYAMAGFISGKFKTGEYFLNNKLLTLDQLQMALDEQNRIEKENGKNVKYLEILDSMGLVNAEENKIIFLLQEEAKKRFILDYNLVPDAERTFENTDEKYSAEIEALKAENKKLKEKLVQLLQLVKKNV